MAHELTESDHMVSGSSVTPWHGLGTILPDNLTASAALEAARLNWQVTQESTYDGDMKEHPLYLFNRRSDTRAVLGVVEQGWQPVQNERLLEIAESLAQVDGVDYRPVIETAGSLRGGRIVWALVRTGERSFADSTHRTYLLLSNGHDGKRALRGTLTDVRVVCANTLRWAEAAESKLYVSHARGVEKRVQTALTTLGWANEATRATFAIYAALAAAKITADSAHVTFRKLIAADAETLTKGETESVEAMMTLFRSGRGNEGKSAFDLVNAATDWADHVKNYRDDERRAERRFLSSSMGGEADRLKTAAFSAARRLASIA
jgi:phage/plasmid-like protein (TIGR03299 family)